MGCCNCRIFWYLRKGRIKLITQEGLGLTTVKKFQIVFQKAWNPSAGKKKNFMKFLKTVKVSKLLLIWRVKIASFGLHSFFAHNVNCQLWQLRIPLSWLRPADWCEFLQLALVWWLSDCLKVWRTVKCIWIVEAHHQCLTYLGVWCKRKWWFFEKWKWSKAVTGHEHFSKQFETRRKKPDDRKIWAQLDLVVSILFCYYLEWISNLKL